MSHNRHYSADFTQLQNQVSHYRRLSSANIVQHMQQPALITSRSVSENSSFLMPRQVPLLLTNSVSSSNVSSPRSARVRDGLFLKVIHEASNEVRGEVYASIDDIILSRQQELSVQYPSSATFSWHCRLPFRFDDVIRLIVRFTDDELLPEIVHMIDLSPSQVKELALHNPIPDMYVISPDPKHRILMNFKVVSENFLELQSMQIMWSMLPKDVQKLLQRRIIMEKINLLHKKMIMYRHLHSIENSLIMINTLSLDANIEPVKEKYYTEINLVQMNQFCIRLEAEMTKWKNFSP